MALRIVMNLTKSGNQPLHGEADSQGERQLELHDHWIGYEERDLQRSVIDFERRCRIEMNQIERTYSEHVLLSDVAFRHFELRNRCNITSVLRAGGATTKDFSATLHEHNLAMIASPQNRNIPSSAQRGPSWLHRLFSNWRRGGKSNADILVGKDQEWLTFTTATGGPLVQYSANDTRCNTTLLRRFTQFLRYSYPMHPLVLDRMETGRYIPKQIQFPVAHNFDGPSSGVRLAILAVEEIRDRAYSVDGYKNVMRSDQGLPIDSSIERVMTQPIPPQSDLVALRDKEIKTFWSTGKPLEAALSYLELIIETGSAPHSLSESVHTSADSRVRRLLEAMQPKNAGEAQDAISLLVKWRAEVSRGSQILMTFEAGARAGLGQTDEAIELLTKAIETNPYLVGAYKDLGDQYARKYQFERAWRCWSAARHISPTHPMLEEVSKLEGTLLAQHPEYF